MGFGFAVGAALFGAADIRGEEPRAGVEPAGERGVRKQPGRFAREVGKDGLRDILGQVRVAVHLPQRGGMDKVDVPRDQFRNGGFRLVAHISLQQFTVGHAHLNI